MRVSSKYVYMASQRRKQLSIRLKTVRMYIILSSDTGVSVLLLRYTLD